ncbi:hypothetical protein CZ765_12975 [Corynebacterium casei]|nr:hypothetical protein CZ765_12975 [Corynebacterium casei]
MTLCHSSYFRGDCWKTKKSAATDHPLYLGAVATADFGFNNQIEPRAFYRRKVLSG